MIELLARKNGELSFAEISEGLHIPPSSLWRILGVLKQRGYVHFDDRRRVYRLGFQFLYMNNSLMSSIGYRSLTFEYLKMLSELSGETTELDVRIKDQLVLVEQIEGPDAHMLYSYPGSVMPYFHATAPGKIYLAHMKAEKVNSVSAKLGLPKITENTITDFGHLEKELEGIRSTGYAFDFEELREGVCRISAPIYDKGNKVLGCFTIACPSFRLDKNSARKDNLGLLVKRIAPQFTVEYGRL